MSMEVGMESVPMWKRPVEALSSEGVKELHRLQAESAKLRGLVQHLYEYRQAYFKTGIYPTDHGVTEQRMRELGIEVDG